MTKRKKKQLRQNLLRAALAAGALLGMWWLGCSLAKDFMGLFR